MTEEKCPFTGMGQEDCVTMLCHPPLFFFKFMLVNYQIETIDDLITALEDRKAFFEKIKNDGFILMGPVDDHVAELESPLDDDEYYWVQCRSGGCYLKIEQGSLPPSECPECGKNVFEYEE